MPKYRCNDIDCSNYHIEVIIPKVKSKYDPVANRVVSNDTICPICKQDMEFIADKDDFSGFTTHFGKFASASPEEKKAILKARSRDLTIPQNKYYNERKKAIDAGKLSV